jgi:diacylglycerol kinase
MTQFVKPRSIKEGFQNAFSGLLWAFKNQLNFKLHILSLLLVFMLSLFFKLNITEWLLIISVSFMVITLELINTSIEQTTDAITTEFNPYVKRAKDMSAASVLIYAIYAVLVAVLIFLPKVSF